MTPPFFAESYRAAALLICLSIGLSACGFVSAPVKHAGARTAQVGVQLYDEGVDKGEKAAIIVRDTALLAADVTAQTSVKAYNAASEVSQKAWNKTKEASVSAYEQAKILPSRVKTAVVGPEAAQEAGMNEDSSAQQN
ncbi:MAG: hypothetical protein R3332_01075 [Pseudohongiellaceae bacterium]|nr:hypothetical protein [Pseudohongiellaceae bacterium]